MTFRLCAFNVENLFARLDFDAFTDARAALYLPESVQLLGSFGDSDFSRFGAFKAQLEAATLTLEDDMRQQTALAMVEANADLYALQEVDDITALDRFTRLYLGKATTRPFPHRVLFEGNDGRGIDVAGLAAAPYPIYGRSHAEIEPPWLEETGSGQELLEQYPEAKKRADQIADNRNPRIFRRDCLEMRIDVNGQELAVYNCHFKSMGGTPRTSFRTRQLEALTVREIINRQFEDPATALWAVCGDLNDAQSFRKVAGDGMGLPDSAEETRIDAPPHEIGGETGSGVDPLLDDGFGMNLVASLPEDEQWTQYFAPKRHKTQLDYIIASPALAAKMIGQPQIIRAGMPYRVPNLDIARYPRTGWDRPKASDHCPVVVEFDL